MWLRVFVYTLSALWPWGRAERGRNRIWAITSGAGLRVLPTLVVGRVQQTLRETARVAVFLLVQKSAPLR